MKILVVLVMFFSFLFGNKDIGKVLMLRGAVQCHRNTQEISLKIGDAIQEGDKIVVAKRSKIQIMLNDETLITLGSKTEYSFDKYNDSDKPELKMSMNRGFLRTISGKIGKLAPKRFKLKTKSATIGIRGTGWETYIGLNVENTLCFKGEVVITTPQQTFEVPAGTMLLMTNSKAKRYKANVHFFHKQIKKIEAKIEKKEKQEEHQTTSQEKNSEQKKESHSSEIKKDLLPEEVHSTIQEEQISVEENTPTQEDLDPVEIQEITTPLEQNVDAIELDNAKIVQEVDNSKNSSQEKTNDFGNISLDEEELKQESVTPIDGP